MLKILSHPSLQPFKFSLILSFIFTHPQSGPGERVGLILYLLAGRKHSTFIMWQGTWSISVGLPREGERAKPDLGEVRGRGLLGLSIG